LVSARVPLRALAPGRTGAPRLFFVPQAAGRDCEEFTTEARRHRGSRDSGGLPMRTKTPLGMKFGRIVFSVGKLLSPRLRVSLELTSIRTNFTAEARRVQRQKNSSTKQKRD